MAANKLEIADPPGTFKLAVTHIQTLHLWWHHPDAAISKTRQKLTGMEVLLPTAFRRPPTLQIPATARCYWVFYPCVYATTLAQTVYHIEYQIKACGQSALLLQCAFMCTFQFIVSALYKRTEAADQILFNRSECYYEHIRSIIYHLVFLIDYMPVFGRLYSKNYGQWATVFAFFQKNKFVSSHTVRKNNNKSFIER